MHQDVHSRNLKQKEKYYYKLFIKHKRTVKFIYLISIEKHMKWSLEGQPQIIKKS